MVTERSGEPLERGAVTTGNYVRARGIPGHGEAPPGAICFFVSLPRPLSQLSGMGVFSAVTMGIAVLLAIIFAGIQDHPFGHIVGQEPLVTRVPVAGTTYVAGAHNLYRRLYAYLISSCRHVGILEHHLRLRWSDYPPLGMYHTFLP